MKYGHLVFDREYGRDLNAFFQRFYLRIVCNKLIGLLGDDLFKKRRDILEVIIERIAVDTAILYYVFYAYLGKRFFI